VSHRNQFVAAALVFIGVLPLGAQARVVNLTGNPQAELDEPFTSINGLQEVAPGKIVVSDMQEQRLILADLNANTIKNIGSKGGGPGEWQFAMNVSPGPGGTAYVADPNLRRMHVIDASGKIASTVPFPGAEAEEGATVRITIPRGTDVQGRIFYTGPPFTPGVQRQPDSIPIIRWDPRTKKTDTLGMMKNEAIVTQSGSGGNNRVMARVGGGPYSPQVVWAPLPNGRVAVVHPQPYRVDILDAAVQASSGTPVPFTPVRIGKAERDAYRNRSPGRGMTITMGGPGGGGMRVGSGGPPPNVPPTPDSEFPAVMPPFSGNGIIVAPNSEIWVLRNRPAADPTPTYDIFSPTGQLTGKATLRPNSTVIGFGQGAVYVSRQDPEDDLRYLEKYPLR
jgi:hypothetical protein